MSVGCGRTGGANEEEGEGGWVKLFLVERVINQVIDCAARIMDKRGGIEGRVW